MAGHMGSTSITVQNLSVVVVDRDLGLIGVSGSVPGVSGSYVRICDSIKYRTDLDVISNLNGFSVMYESASS
jgi:ribosomal protein L3